MWRLASEEMPQTLVAVAGVPGQRRVQIGKNAVTGHEHLAAAMLLARAAVIADGARLAGLLQIVLYRHRRGQRTAAQGAVPAAVAVAALFHRLLDRAAGFLAQPGQGVELAQDADHRLAAAPAAHKCGGDARQALLHLKALRFQHLDQRRRAFRLLEVQLRRRPDAVVHRDEAVGLCVHETTDFVPQFHFPRLLL